MITTYKSFIRHHLVYGDIIYDHSDHVSFSDKIESIQYTATLAITGAIKATSKEEFYKELDLESSIDRRRLKWLNYINKLPSYLYELVLL